MRLIPDQPGNFTRDPASPLVIVIITGSVSPHVLNVVLVFESSWLLSILNLHDRTKYSRQWTRWFPVRFFQKPLNIYGVNKFVFHIHYYCNRKLKVE